MTSGVSEEDYIRGNRSGPYGKPAIHQPSDNRHNMEYARTMLWKDLHGFRIKAGTSTSILVKLPNQWRLTIISPPRNLVFV